MLGVLRHSTAVPEMPAAGGTAECRIESVQVRGGRPRAVVSIAFRAQSDRGPIVLTGHMEHDLKEKLLVMVALDGTVAGEKISIRGTRVPTKYIPPR